MHAELWQLINNLKRESSDEITYLTIGFAMEDLSVLKMIYNMSNKYNIGQNIDMIPNITDPKIFFQF